MIPPLVAATMLFWSTDLFASFALGLNQEFSGGTAPVSNIFPWVNADFHDNGNGSVRLTLSNPHLTASENVSEFYFNFKDSLNLADLTFTFVNSSGSFTLPNAGDIAKSQNQFKADGDGLYDVRIDFAVGGNLNQTFGVGDQVVYDLAYTSPITAADFFFQSFPDGGHGPFYAAAHVQNTGIHGNSSGWLAPVPEPTTLTLAAAMLAVPLGRRVIRSFRKQA
ncbi:MAG: hypothetical protein JWR69_3574 [Pedosphaera sp.]|nr:hypothetical protein [Pedosphaera sp.]